MLVKFTMQVLRTQVEYLYGLASSQRLFTMQVTDSWRVSIYNKYANICMKCIKCMILNMNMQQSYADDLECQNERIQQQLKGLGIDPYSAETSTARPSDTYHSEPSREWSPWLMLISRMICLEDGALGQILIIRMIDFDFFLYSAV